MARTKASELKRKRDAIAAEQANEKTEQDARDALYEENLMLVRAREARARVVGKLTDTPTETLGQSEDGCDGGVQVAALEFTRTAHGCEEPAALTPTQSKGDV